MKILKKLLVIFLCVAVFATVLCSCSNASGKATSISYPDAEYSNEFYRSDYSESSNEDKSIAYNQMLVKKFTVYMDTKNFEETLEKLKNEITGYGYISNSNVQQSSSKYSIRSASYTFRVDSDRVEEFVDKISKFGNVTNTKSSVEDITKQYYDLESQMESLIEEKSHFEALRKGADYASLIAIEDKIANLTSQINYLNSQIEFYKSSVNYSYVYLTVNEVKEYVAVEETFWDELGNTIKGSLQAFVDVLHVILNVFIYTLPFAIVFGIIAVIIIVCIKKNKKKKENKPETKQEDQQ